MNPKVSIIIPVYNSEKYLKKCFDSIIDNNYDNLEVIPINDGSKDGSQDVIDEYKKKYPKIFKPIKQKNQGIGATRNNGIKKSTGDYIMFIDNDDFIDKDYIKTHVKEVEKEDYDVVISGYRRVSDKDILFQVELDGRYRWSRYISIAPWGKLFKASFLRDNDINFLVTPIGEDVYFNLQVNTITEKIKIIDYIGYNWYYNGISVTNTITNKIKKINITNLLDTHYGVLKNKDSINEGNKDIVELYFIVLVIQFLQWIAKGSKFKEVSNYCDSLYGWLKEHFPNFKHCKHWKLMKGDRLKIKLIIATVMTCYKLHLVKLLIYLYGRV